MASDKKLDFLDVEFKQKAPKFTLFIVTFTDDHGKTYSWAPKWKDLSEIFNLAAGAEHLNGGADWMKMVEASLCVIAGILNNFSGKKLSSPKKGEIPKEWITVRRHEG